MSLIFFFSFRAFTGVPFWYTLLRWGSFSALLIFLCIFLKCTKARHRRAKRKRRRRLRQMSRSAQWPTFNSGCSLEVISATVVLVMWFYYLPKFLIARNHLWIVWVTMYYIMYVLSQYVYQDFQCHYKHKHMQVIYHLIYLNRLKNYTIIMLHFLYNILKWNCCKKVKQQQNFYNATMTNDERGNQALPCEHF